MRREDVGKTEASSHLGIPRDGYAMLDERYEYCVCTASQQCGGSRSSVRLALGDVTIDSADEARALATRGLLIGGSSQPSLNAVIVIQDCGVSWTRRGRGTVCACEGVKAKEKIQTPTRARLKEQAEESVGRTGRASKPKCPLGPTGTKSLTVYLCRKRATQALHKMQARYRLLYSVRHLPNLREEVFMTRQDILQCVHEPFGDAFYFGPERLSTRYENDEKARDESGFANSTYKTIFERLEREGEEGKRLFIKDIIHYLVPPEGQPATIAPSLGGKTVKKGVGTDSEVNGVSNGVANGHNNEVNGHCTGVNVHTQGTNRKPPYPYATLPEPGNPTVVPAFMLTQFHFTFLIRHPRSSIPSYYRCTIPPLSSMTGFQDFMPSEAGYVELRAVFDFLRTQGQVGPSIAGQHTRDDNEETKKGKEGEISITVIDADDLLDNPKGIIKAYCKEVGIEYKDSMLNWDTESDHQRAKDAFEKWRGFHEDAIRSTALRPRDLGHSKKPKGKEAENEEWKAKYGEQGMRVIRSCVDENVGHYEYLKGFALRV
ncbi:hypothetical protein B7494_g5185 [Chlorociboria aeruginascens]|nr:hypothetical protein B7494_g5185 [Chlorociboria aeruginascens]